MRKVFIFGGIFALGYIISSCGSSSVSESKGDEGMQTQASTEEAIESRAVKTGDRIYNLVLPPQSVAAPVPPMPTMPQGFGMMSAKSMDMGMKSKWKCEGGTTGNLNDIDDDGVPVDGKYEFQCQMTSSNCQMEHKGIITVKDDNDNDKLSGYNVCTGQITNNQCSRDPITMSGSCGGSSGKLERIMDFNLDRNGNLYKFTSFFFQWKLYQSQTATTPDATVTLESSNLSFAAENDGDDEIFNSGTWNGAVSVRFEESSGSSGYCSIELTDLKVSKTCGGAESGSIQYTCSCPQGSQEPNMNFTLSFTSCGKGSISWMDCSGQSGKIGF